MIDLDTLRLMLTDRNLQVVARGSGVHPNSLYRLVNGSSRPKYETVQKVMTYLERQGASGNG